MFVCLAVFVCLVALHSGRHRSLTSELSLSYARPIAEWRLKSATVDPMALHKYVYYYYYYLLAAVVVCQVWVEGAAVVQSCCQSCQHAEGVALSHSSWSQQWTVCSAVRRHLQPQQWDDVISRDRRENGRLSTWTAPAGCFILVREHHLVVEQSPDLVSTDVSCCTPRWCVVGTFRNISTWPITKRTEISRRLAVYVWHVCTSCCSVWSPCQQCVHAALREDLIRST